MNIFLIWSGPLSHAVALALHEWIPLVLQRVKPFLSSEDIDKGSRWQQDVAKQLATVQFAIVCLTPENLMAPWIHFEAGAVSNELDAAKVTSLLIAIEPADIVGPLTQFQNTALVKTDLKKLISNLNKALGDEGLPETQLSTTFDTFWPQLESKLETARASAKPVATKTKRSTDELLGEILEVSRSTSRSVSSLVAMEERVLSSVESGSIRSEPSIGNALLGLTGFPWRNDPIVKTDEQLRRDALVHALLSRTQTPQQAIPTPQPQQAIPTPQPQQAIPTRDAPVKPQQPPKKPTK